MGSARTRARLPGRQARLPRRTPGARSCAPRIPAQRLKLRTVFGAYVAGVGVNAVVPARGRGRREDVPRQAAAAGRVATRRWRRRSIVETLFDSVVATGLLIWALSLGVLPTHQVYSKLPTRRLAVLRPARPPEPRAPAWRCSSRRSSGSSGRACAGASSSARVGAGLRDPARPAPVPAERDRSAGDLLGVPDRRPVLLPAGVRRPREPAQRAAGAGGRLAGDALPGDPGRRRHEAGADRLPVPPPGGVAGAAARVQRRHEHRARRREPRCSASSRSG